MALKDIFTGLFRSKGASLAFTSDKDIDQLTKALQDLRVASENKELTIDGIEEIREALFEVSPTIERVLSGILENLNATELIAIDNQVKADQEDAIENPKEEKLKREIESIKERKLTAKEIQKMYIEAQIVDMGLALGLKVEIKLAKKKNAEILHKGIFK